jgi:hypothetical protein
MMLNCLVDSEGVGLQINNIGFQTTRSMHGREKAEYLVLRRFDVQFGDERLNCGYRIR